MFSGRANMGTLSEILREKEGQPLRVVDGDRTVLDAVRQMNEYGIGALIVMQGGRMSGIFTERDVLRRVVGDARDPATVQVAEVMTTRVVCCTPATTIEEA